MALSTREEYTTRDLGNFVKGGTDRNPTCESSVSYSRSTVLIFTARVRSTTEGYVFTGVSLSVHTGGGVCSISIP